jgi:hypothetical protein
MSQDVQMIMKSEYKSVQRILKLSFWVALTAVCIHFASIMYTEVHKYLADFCLPLNLLLFSSVVTSVQPASSD